MGIHTTESADAYATAVLPFLEEDPCARNVLLTVIDTMRAAPGSYSAPPSFWWVTADTGQVCGAASWTPPYPLLVSAMPDTATTELAASMIARAASLGIKPPGVNGPERAAHAVAAAWTAATGDRIKRARTILLNELDQLVDVPVPPGAARVATLGDVPLLAEWLTAFGAEVELIVGLDPRATAEHAVRAGIFDVWIADTTAVCVVGHRVAGGVLRVGPVYTPPQHRNRGYGRRLTYEVTARALMRPDVQRCMLFTDADNPVSNSIYRQAGYVARDRHVEIALA
jgi:GNAT superfamily N-acetyltransferase